MDDMLRPLGQMGCERSELLLLLLVPFSQRHRHSLLGLFVGRHPAFRVTAYQTSQG